MAAEAIMTPQLCLWDRIWPEVGLYSSSSSSSSFSLTRRWPVRMYSRSSSVIHECMLGGALTIMIQGSNHNKPIAPTIIKTICQLKCSVKKAIIGNAMIPPMAAPELNRPCASARSLVGNHSALPFVAPGQLPASAIPKMPRNMLKLTTPLAKAWAMVARDQTPMERTKPTRVPTQSKIFPKMAWPNA